MHYSAGIYGTTTDSACMFSYNYVLWFLIGCLTQCILAIHDRENILLHIYAYAINNY